MGEFNNKMEEMTLPGLFEQARKIHSSVTDSGAADQEVVRKGCETLQECEEMVNKLGLFSSNETKDDISNTNLKYILVPFYLAEMSEKVVQDNRLQILKASQAKLKEFISFCEAMELVPKEELGFYTQGAQKSVADQRAMKIARFKRLRAAESKLSEIKERKERRGRSTRAAAMSTPVEAGEEEVLDDDGEEEREAWNGNCGGFKLWWRGILMSKQVPIFVVWFDIDKQVQGASAWRSTEDSTWTVDRLIDKDEPHKLYYIKKHKQLTTLKIKEPPIIVMNE